MMLLPFVSCSSGTENASDIQKQAKGINRMIDKLVSRLLENNGG